MEQYRNFVKSLAESGENRTFLNSDEDHAVEVLVQLFRLANEDVRIFASSLCEHVGNRQEYIVAISEFIERGGRLFILLNGYKEELSKESSLFKRLAYYKSKGCPVFVRKTNAHPYRTSDPDRNEVHFTIGDKKSYRIETNTEKRTAECNFNSPTIATVTADFFDKLFNDDRAEEIDLIKLFDDGNK